MWWRLGQIDISTLGLLAAFELKAGLSWELEVVRCELASSKVVGLLLMDIFLHNAKLGEVLYWDQPMQVYFLGRCQAGKSIYIGIVCSRDLDNVVLDE